VPVMNKTKVINNRGLNIIILNLSYKDS